MAFKFNLVEFYKKVFGELDNEDKRSPENPAYKRNWDSQSNYGIVEDDETITPNEQRLKKFCG